jgi:hypothetical protein
MDDQKPKAANATQSAILRRIGSTPDFQSRARSEQERVSAFSRAGCKEKLSGGCDRNWATLWLFRGNV